MRRLLSRRAGVFGAFVLIGSTFFPWVVFWASCPAEANTCLASTMLWWPEFSKDIVAMSQGGDGSSSPWFFSAWLAGALVLAWAWITPRLRRRSRPTAHVISALVAAVAIVAVVISIWHLAWLLGYWIQPPLGYGYQYWLPGPGFVLHFVGALLVVLSALGEITDRWGRTPTDSPSLDADRSATALQT